MKDFNNVPNQDLQLHITFLHFLIWQPRSFLIVQKLVIVNKRILLREDMCA